MLETILNERVIFVLMGALAVVGILSKCVVNVTLKRLVKAAGNMNKSSHPLMRLVRAKFEHASMVSDKVENVKVFVDKYLYEHKVLGIRLHSLRRLEKMAAGLCLISGAVGAGLEYSVNGPGDMVWQTGAAGAGLAVLVYLIHLSTDERYQMDAIRNYMVDYLENVCRHRYEKEKTNQKGIKVLTQEGIQTDFGVMPDEETRREVTYAETLVKEAGNIGEDYTEKHIREAGNTGEDYIEKHIREAGNTGEDYVEKHIQEAENTGEDYVEKHIRKMESSGRDYKEKQSEDNVYAVRKREPGSKKSAVDTFHAAELIADEAINAFRAAEAKKQTPVSQSDPMDEILAAEAKRGESVRDNIAELPAAEFVRETMEPARMEKPKAPRREKAEEELDRDIVIRRILEEFMA